MQVCPSRVGGGGNPKPITPGVNMSPEVDGGGGDGPARNRLGLEALPRMPRWE